MPITTKPLKLWVQTPLMARYTLYNITWWSLSVTCGRSVIFSGYSDFLYPIELSWSSWSCRGHIARVSPWIQEVVLVNERLWGHQYIFFLDISNISASLADILSMMLFSVSMLRIVTSSILLYVIIIQYIKITYNSNMTSIIGYLNNMIKLTIYFNSHMRIDEQITSSIP